MPKECIVIGCGSHASSVISVIESCLEEYLIIGLVDTGKTYNQNETKSGYKVEACLEMLLSEPENYHHLQCIMALGDNNQRKEVFSELKNKHFDFPNIISNKAIVDRTVIMGEGNVVVHGAIINAQTILGDNNIVNTASVIEHDCVLGSHIHIGPKAVLCGNVKVGHTVMIGAAATVVPKLKIAPGSTLGAGALLTTDIQKDNSVFIGLPARIRPQ